MPGCIILRHGRQYMSLLLVEQADPPSAPLQLALHNIDRLMTQQFGAIALTASRGTIYRSLLAVSQRTLQLQWRFEPFRNCSVKVFIRPNLAEAVAGNLRVETQRGFVDLLRVVNGLNRDKNKTMNYLVTELNFLELCAIFALEHLADPKLVRRLIKATLQQLPEAIARLTAALKPFLERQPGLEEESISRTARLFLEKSHKLLQLSRFNQLKQRDEQACVGQKARLMSAKEIEEKLEQARAEAHKKIKEAFKMMVVEESLPQEDEGAEFVAYTQWLSRRKLSAKTKEKEGKNIFGIKILEEGSAVGKERTGSHCRLTLSRCRVLLMTSLNIQVNSHLQQMRTSASVYKQTQLQIMKKVVKHLDRQEALNSFQNELDFMLYIKEKYCPQISTYYWPHHKKRHELDEILMDHYPHNLREMLHSQGKYLSFRQKIVLMRSITAALHWLANNYACHRDLKPDNIMISHQRTPKLIDFGSCCPVYGIGLHYFSVKDTRLLGTPQYYRSYDETMAFAYRRAEYEQHALFDAFSLGKVMRDIFQEGLPNLLPNLQALTAYMIQRCEEADPVDRMTFQEVLYLLDSMLSYFDWLEEE